MSRRILFAVLAMGTGQIAVYLVRPTTSYRLLGLGHGATAVGVVAATFALIPLFLAIPLGRRADRRQGARLLAFGCGVETLGCALLAVGQSALALAGASAVLGIGHLAVALGSQAVIARESDDASHDRNFALLTAGVSIGQLFGPLLGGLLLAHHTGHGLVTASGRAMLVAAGIAALATAFALVAERDRPQDDGAAERPGRGTVRSILGTPGVAAAIFASVAVLSATDIFTAYLPVVGEHRHIGPAIVGVLLALRAGASLLSRIGISTLVARIGRVRLMAVAAFAAALAFAALTATASPVLLGALAIAVGLGLGFAQPLSMTIVVQLVPEHVRASALAIRLTGNRLGQVAAPAAAGLLAGSAGAFSVFWMTSGLLVASGVAVAKRPRPVAEDAAHTDELAGA